MLSTQRWECRVVYLHSTGYEALEVLQPLGPEIRDLAFAWSMGDAYLVSHASCKQPKGFNRNVPGKQRPLNSWCNGPYPSTTPGLNLWSRVTAPFLATMQRRCTAGPNQAPDR